MTEHRTHFLHYINSIDPHIQFTTEEPNTDGSILFIDTHVTPGPDNTTYNSLQVTYPHRPIP